MMLRLHISHCTLSLSHARTHTHVSFVINSLNIAIYSMFLNTTYNSWQRLILFYRHTVKSSVDDVRITYFSLMVCSMGRNVRKHTFLHVRPTKTQISLRIRSAWSESSLSVWRNFASLVIQNAPSEDTDQTARMRRLIWIFSGRIYPKVSFLTLRLLCSLFCT